MSKEILVTKIPSRYLLIYDNEVVFSGSKKQCVDYFNSLPNPYPMKLNKIESQRELRKHD